MIQCWNIRVLLVEDNPGDVLLIRKALEEIHPSHRLILAADGLDAMHTLLRDPPYENVSRPDLIILDLNLPRMSGQELIEHLSRIPEFQSIPLVVLTSSPQDQHVLWNWPAGKSLYLIKPPTFNELRQRVEEIVCFYTATADRSSG